MAKKSKKNGGIEETEQVETPLTSPEKNIVNDIWNFLSSMKLGIILLLILAIASIIGTVWVPKNSITGQEDFAKFYNSIPFRLLLGLLVLNLFVCSANRWKTIINTLRGPKPDFSDAFLKTLKSAKAIKLGSNDPNLTNNLSRILKSKRYRVFINRNEETGTTKIAADRGALGILGPYISHISFLVLIIAVVIKFSGLAGFEGMLSGAVGQTYDLNSVTNVQGTINPSDNFSIKINNFRTEYRPDGSVKQWYSDVTVMDQQKTFDYSIYVNNPLVYKGIKMYQMSYGSQYTGTVSSPSLQNQPFNVGSQDYIQPQGTDITFIPMGFDSTTNKIAVDIYKGNQGVGKQEIQLNVPYKYDQSEITFTASTNFTVLSVKKDPGLPFAGAGSILLIIGVMISFLLRQRRIWASVTEGVDGAMVSIAGISAKDKRGLDTDIEDIIGNLED